MVAHFRKFLLLTRGIALCVVMLAWVAGVAAGATHTSDIEADADISLSELLRVIQFYNSDGFGCDAVTEDGYVPGGGETECAPHDSDYAPRDWRIALSELLRLVQLYNSARYHADPAGEDGFAPGLGAAWVRQYPVVDAPHADVHVAGAALAPDGGLYVVGSAEESDCPPEQGACKVMLLRIDPAGVLAWSRLLDLGGWAQATGVVVEPDGSLILAGNRRDDVNSVIGAFLLRADAGGEVVSETLVPAPGSMLLSSLIAVSDGALYCTGAREPSLDAQYDIWVASVNDAPAITRSKSYSVADCQPDLLSPCSEWGTQMIETSDHGFLVGGTILRWIGPALQQSIILRLAPDLTQRWLWLGPDRYVGVPAASIIEFANGTVLGSLSLGSYESDGVFLSATGVKLWSRTYAIDMVAALSRGNDALVAGLASAPDSPLAAIGILTSGGDYRQLDAFQIAPDPEVAALLRAPSGACYIVGATLDSSSSNSAEWRGQVLVIKTLPVL